MKLFISLVNTICSADSSLSQRKQVILTRGQNRYFKIIVNYKSIHLFRQLIQ